MSYIIRKIASAFAVLLGVVFLIFALFMLFPSAEEISVGQRADESTRAAMRAEMGLDQPKSGQLLKYLSDLSPVSVNGANETGFTGFFFHLSESKVLWIKFPYLRKSYMSRRPVAEILGEAFIGSFVLAFFAMGLALFLGISGGVVSAISPGSLTDKLFLAVSTLGISLPSFFVAVIIAWFFGFVIRDYTGLSMTGSLFRLDPVSGENRIAWRHVILPAFALGIRPYSVILQLTRSNLIDVLKQDYIRTARAKGLSQLQVIRRHALRNALNPVVTASSGWFAGLLAGAFFIEYVFSWKGLGKVTIDALQQSDLPVVMGAVLLIAFIFIAVNVLVDLIYVLLDPRVKLK